MSRRSYVPFIVGAVALLVVGLALGKDRGGEESLINTTSAVLLTIGFLGVVVFSAHRTRRPRPEPQLGCPIASAPPTGRRRRTPRPRRPGRRIAALACPTRSRPTDCPADVEPAEESNPALGSQLASPRRPSSHGGKEADGDVRAGA